MKEKRNKKRGSLIVFEGPEGSGKSTLIRRVCRVLKKKGYRVLQLREPGGVKISEAIRNILLNKANTKMSANAELLLYLAARAQLVNEKMEPALRKGIVVVCDRFEASTLAYQGYGREMSVSRIRQVSRWFVRGNLRPGLAFFLDVPVCVGLKRGGRHDRMERLSLLFHERVRRGFLKLAAEKKYPAVVVDTVKPIVQSIAAVEREIHDRF